MLSRLWPGLVLALTLVVLGCKHTPAPYPRGDQPPLEVLLRATSPQLDAILVSDADVVVNRLYRGDLAFLAQTPRRFSGSVSKSGNELITLAFHEQGYALRNKFDQAGIPVGYYAGPPDDCVVEAMLGVELPSEGLVALVLGGGPVLDPPYEILEQKWDKKEAYERLVIANEHYVEELRFAWVDQQWRFTGAAMYRRGAKEKKRVCPTRKDRAKWGALLWALEHEKFGRQGEIVLPGRTRVRSPGKRRDNLFVITYKSRDLDPAFAKSTAGGDDGKGDEGGADDGWEADEGDWEDDDGWEDEPPAEDEPAGEPLPEEPTESAEGEAPAEEMATASGAARRAAPAAAPAPRVEDVPPEFRLSPSGLTVRGDLCR